MLAAFYSLLSAGVHAEDFKIPTLPVLESKLSELGDLLRKTDEALAVGQRRVREEMDVLEQRQAELRQEQDEFDRIKKRRRNIDYSNPSEAAKVHESLLKLELEWPEKIATRSEACEDQRYRIEQLMGYVSLHEASRSRHELELWKYLLTNRGLWDPPYVASVTLRTSQRAPFANKLLYTAGWPSEDDPLLESERGILGLMEAMEARLRQIEGVQQGIEAAKATLLKADQSYQRHIEEYEGHFDGVADFVPLGYSVRMRVLAEFADATVSVAVNEPSKVIPALAFEAGYRVISGIRQHRQHKAGYDFPQLSAEYHRMIEEISQFDPRNYPPGYIPSRPDVLSQIKLASGDVFPWKRVVLDSNTEQENVVKQVANWVFEAARDGRFEGLDQSKRDALIALYGIASKIPEDFRPSQDIINRLFSNNAEITADAVTYFSNVSAAQGLQSSKIRHRLLDKKVATDVIEGALKDAAVNMAKEYLETQAAKERAKIFYEMARAEIDWMLANNDLSALVYYRSYLLELNRATEIKIAEELVKRPEGTRVFSGNGHNAVPPKVFVTDEVLKNGLVLSVRFSDEVFRPRVEFNGRALALQAQPHSGTEFKYDVTESSVGGVGEPVQVEITLGADAASPPFLDSNPESIPRFSEGGITGLEQGSDRNHSFQLEFPSLRLAEGTAPKLLPGGALNVEYFGPPSDWGPLVVALVSADQPKAPLQPNAIPKDLAYAKFAEAIGVLQIADGEENLARTGITGWNQAPEKPGDYQIRMYCSSTILESLEVSVHSLLGKWRTMAGGEVSLNITSVKQRTVTGTLARPDGVRGTIVGTISGYNLVGTWENSLKVKGSFEFQFDPALKSFQGSWGYEGEERSHSWIGSKLP